MFYEFINWLFSKQMSRAFDNGVAYGVQKGMNDARLERERVNKEVTAECLQISVGEGDVNPVVGMVVDWLDAVPIIFDIVSEQRLVCFGVTMPYCEKTLEILLKIHPSERYHLLAKKTHWRGDQVMYNTPALTFEQIVSKVNNYATTNQTNG